MLFLFSEKKGKSRCAFGVSFSSTIALKFSTGFVEEKCVGGDAEWKKCKRDVFVRGRFFRFLYLFFIYLAVTIDYQCSEI